IIRDADRAAPQPEGRFRVWHRLDPSVRSIRDIAQARESAVCRARNQLRVDVGAGRRDAGHDAAQQKSAWLPYSDIEPVQAPPAVKLHEGERLDPSVTHPLATGPEVVKAHLEATLDRVLQRGE